MIALLLLLQADHPIPPEQRARLDRDADEAVERWSKVLEVDARNVNAYSRRGDARFRKGLFKEALADYDRMVELEPALEKGHWRRGLAYYFVGEPARGARQFEAYHGHDDVDRENGLWRYLCMAKAQGRDAARGALLKYEKEDREPLPAVYRVLSGEGKAEDILPAIEKASIDEVDKETRRFYAHLYLGLILEVDGKTEAAVEHLKKATANRWAPAAGFGPSFMWHVARLKYEQLAAR